MSMKVPPCLSSYSPGDAVCNGDPNGLEDDDRMSCGWRDRCVGLQLYIAETGLAASSFFTAEEGGSFGVAIDSKGLLSLCEKMVKKHGISCGVVTSSGKTLEEVVVEEPAEPADESIQAPRPPRGGFRKRGGSVRIRSKRQGTMSLFRTLQRAIADRFKELKFAKRGQVPAPGQLYVRDRLETSGYARVYLRVPRGRDIPFVHASFRPRTVTLDVELPFDLLKALPHSPEKWKKRMTAIEDGMLGTSIVGLDSDGVIQLVDFIKHLANAGVINLPVTQVTSTPSV